MKTIGYRVNQESYCLDCVREYCLEKLSFLLPDKEMLDLIPTYNLSTEFIVDLTKEKMTPEAEDELYPILDSLDIEEINLNYDLGKKKSNLGKCSNFHELNYPHFILERVIESQI